MKFINNRETIRDIIGEDEVAAMTQEEKETTGETMIKIEEEEENIKDRTTGTGMTQEIKREEAGQEALIDDKGRNSLIINFKFVKIKP